MACDKILIPSEIMPIKKKEKRKKKTVKQKQNCSNNLEIGWILFFAL